MSRFSNFGPSELRSARAALGLGADGFARPVGVGSGRTVRRWQAGERDIRGPVRVLAQALVESRKAWSVSARRFPDSWQRGLIVIDASRRGRLERNLACCASWIWLSCAARMKKSVQTGVVQPARQMSSLSARLTRTQWQCLSIK